MQIHKCDICRKTIKNEMSVHIGLGTMFSNHVELCLICGKDILKLLKDDELIKKEEFIKIL